MFNDLINSIPIVGHINSLRLYLGGNEKEAIEAFYEATRSSAVTAGGVAGAMLGPLGSYAGAAAGGAITDAVTSYFTDEAKGVVQDVQDIHTDISKGKIPIKSSIRTGIRIGEDILAGKSRPLRNKLGPNHEIANKCLRKNRDITGNLILSEIKRHLKPDTSRTRNYRSKCSTTDEETDEESNEESDEKSNEVSDEESNEESDEESNEESDEESNEESDEESYYKNPKDQESGKDHSRSGGKSRDSSYNSNNKSDRQGSMPYWYRDPSGPGSSGNAGGQPPNEHNNNQEEKTKEEPESHWLRFLKLFWYQKFKIELKDIVISGKKIFENINEWQKKDLKDLIRIINTNDNYRRLGIENIVRITEALLNTVADDQVTAHNFVNVAKFVIACLCDQVTEIHEANRNYYVDYDSSLADVSYIISNDSFVKYIVFITFKSLMREIGDLMPSTDIKFVNTITATYHYYKHKFIKSKNKLLLPRDYFDLVRKGLERLLSLPKEMVEGKNVQTVIYQRYDAAVGRRLKIVIKIRPDNSWILSSCYYVDNIYEGDEDGDEWVNGKKVPR